MPFRSLHMMSKRVGVEKYRVRKSDTQSFGSRSIGKYRMRSRQKYTVMGAEWAR